MNLVKYWNTLRGRPLVKWLCRLALIGLVLSQPLIYPTIACRFKVYGMKFTHHSCFIVFCCRKVATYVTHNITGSLYITHWGSSHEGSGRHPRQHGGGRGRRFSKFMANSHRVCSLLRPSFCELIVNVMGHIDAEFRAAVIRHLAAIPA